MAVLFKLSSLWKDFLVGEELNLSLCFQRSTLHVTANVSSAVYEENLITVNVGHSVFPCGFSMASKLGMGFLNLLMGWENIFPQASDQLRWDCIIIRLDRKCFRIRVVNVKFEFKNKFAAQVGPSNALCLVNCFGANVKYKN